MPKSYASKEEIIPVLTELFREYGFSACSLQIICTSTGLGKSSIYHFFPGGKTEMLNTVLKHIEHWFNTEIFAPLEKSTDVKAAIKDMLDNTCDYFHSGQRACLLGTLSLSLCHDQFKQAVNQYFCLWKNALDGLFERHNIESTHNLSEAILSEIQGAIVLARALSEPQLYTRRMEDLSQRIEQAIDASQAKKPKSDLINAVS
jgi:AcrR family transcriptional regulator